MRNEIQRSECANNLNRKDAKILPSAQKLFQSYELLVAYRYFSQMKKAIHTTKAPAAIGPYSQAILVNGFLYTAGQVALIPETGELDMAIIDLETTRVMENLKAILTEAEMDFTNVIKTSIFLSSMDLFAAVNAIYGSYFPEGSFLPARETVAVAGLPKGVNVEISVVAFKG